VQPLSPDLLRDHRPPVLGGRYAVVRLLGRGAQAKVYLAWDRRTRTWVAAKVMSSKFLDDADIRKRFEQEAHTMARLQHPHLLRVFDVGHDGPVPWIIMELAGGGALTQWMRRNGVMPANMAIAVAVQAAEGLDHAHHRGVIHRDVKPHNLLIVDRERVVLTDFGVAQAADASMTATGTVMGTFAYMAPEQRNDSKNVDGRADIYSLSATLYSMITGQPSAELFYADADDDLMAKVPPALRPVLIKACAYKREQRYGTMKDFARALVAASRKLPPVDPTTPPLDDEVIVLPHGPPTRLEAGALEELRSGLGEAEDQPTYIPSSRDALDRMFEQQQTALYHSTSGVDLQDAPTVHHRPEVAAAMDLSEDASTMRPAPSQTGEAPYVADDDDEDGGVMKAIGWTLALAGGLVLSVWGIGVTGNLQARWDVERSADAVVDNAQIAGSSLSAIIDAGADEETLTTAWSAFQASAPGDAVPKALAFADAVEAEVARVEVDDLAMTRIQPMLTSADDYEQAVAGREAQAKSLFGRLSLGVGK
jgi:serine/threonine protein kinase